MLYKDKKGWHHNIHGFIVVLGQPYDPTFFTGTSLDKRIDDAKVFRTKAGAMNALRWYKDHNEECGTPWSQDLWLSRRAVPVKLDVVGKL